MSAMGREQTDGSAVCGREKRTSAALAIWQLSIQVGRFLIDRMMQQTEVYRHNPNFGGRMLTVAFRQPRLSLREKPRPRNPADACHFAPDELPVWP